MDIKRLRPDEIEEHWARVRPWLDAAAKTTSGRFEVGDFVIPLMRGAAELFVCETSAALCQVMAYPHKRYYLVQLLGGEPGAHHDWKAWTDAVTSRARELGLDGVETYGLTGFRIIGKKAGWKNRHSLWEIDFDG
jgi:hypothetical protein